MKWPMHCKASTIYYNIGTTHLFRYILCIKNLKAWVGHHSICVHRQCSTLSTYRSICSSQLCRFYSSSSLPEAGHTVASTIAKTNGVEKKRNKSNQHYDSMDLSNISALYVPDGKASKMFSVLKPYLNFDDIFHNLEGLSDQLKKRGLQETFTYEKLLQLKDGWERYKDAKKISDDLDDKINSTFKFITELKEQVGAGLHSTQISGGAAKSDTCTPSFSEINRKLDEANNTYSQYRKAKIKNSPNFIYLQETVIPQLLKIPNMLDSITPIQENVVKLSLHNLPHIKQSECEESIGKIEILDKVGFKSLYLRGQLSEMELALQDYFVNIFDEMGYVHHCNPDFGKGVIVEGCAYDIHNKSEVLKLLHSSLDANTNPHFLMGGLSLPSFLGYFAKRAIMKTDKHLPQKIFATGKLYRPPSVPSNGATLMQSTGVAAMIGYSKNTTTKKSVVDELVALLTSSYTRLGLHFRIVQKKACELRAHEESAITIEMLDLSCSEDEKVSSTYREVGRISVIGNYISKRLWLLHDSEKNKETLPKYCFLHFVYAEVMDISRFITTVAKYEIHEDGQLLNVLKTHMIFDGNI